MPSHGMRILRLQRLEQGSRSVWNGKQDLKCLILIQRVWLCKFTRKDIRKQVLSGMVQRCVTSCSAHLWFSILKLQYFSGRPVKIIHHEKNYRVLVITLFHIPGFEIRKSHTRFHLVKLFFKKPCTVRCINYLLNKFNQ